MTQRYYSATCREGRCEGVSDFCESEVTMASTAELRADELDEATVLELRGQLVTVTGSPSLGPISCGCCAPDCDACDDPLADWTLDCQVALRGSVCGQTWRCGSEVAPECHFRELEWAWRYTAQGYLVDDLRPDGLREAELWMLHGTDECGPLGPNPAGTPCEAFSEDHGCDEGLICHYWGDVISLCDGTCTPPGTECTTETQDADCDDSEICYEGYCEWCCPG